MFGKKPKPKTYNEFVAPLKDMIANLTNYVTEQLGHIDKQEEKKREIEADIANSEIEIQSSRKTIDKLEDIVV